MTKADELWEKHCHEDRRVDGGQYMMWDDFLAALAEYGEAVRAEAKKVCGDQENGHVMSKYAKVSDCQIARQSAHDCAAAIEKMKLP